MSLTYEYSKWSNIADYASYIVDRHFNASVLLGAYIEDPVKCEAFIRYCINNGLAPDVYISAIPHITGVVEQESTGNASKMLSVDFSGVRSGSGGTADYIGDMSQATLVNQPKLLKYSGEKYYWGSGVMSNYCSATKSASISNVFEVITKVNLVFPTGGNYCFLGSTNGGGIDIYITGNKYIHYELNNGVLDVNSGVAISYAENTDFWIKVIRDHTLVQFYTSHDGTTWTQLGTDKTITDTATEVQTLFTIGSYVSPIGGFMQNGRIYKYSISDTIGGAPTVNFDFTNFNPAISETTWTATTGETWTLNRPVTWDFNYRSTIVTRTKLQQNTGYMESGSFVNTDYVSIFILPTFFDTPTLGYYKALYTNNDSESPLSGYLDNSLLYEASWASNTLGIYTNGVLANISFPINNKKVLLTATARGMYPDPLKFQSNKNTIQTGINGTYSTPFKKLKTINNNYPSPVQNEPNMYIVLKGDNQSNDAFKDFLNTTIFNGEIY